MNRHSQILERMRRTNPVPDLELIHESDLAALTSLLNERRSTMTDLREPTTMTRGPEIPSPPWWRRPAWIFAAAVVVLLAAIGTTTFLTAGESGVPDVGSDPTVTTPTSVTPPTTQPAPNTTPTTPAQTTTLPAPPALGPPVVNTYIEDIAFDGSGDAWVTTWMPDASELYRLHDGTWTSVTLPPEFAEPGAVRSAPDGSVWVTGQGGLARYEDGDWTVYRPEDGDCGPTLAIDTNGGVWAICPDTFLRIEGNELVPFEVLGESAWGGWWVTAGPNGSVHNSGFLELLSFDGAEWSYQTCPATGPSGLGCAQLLGVEPDGDVWTAYGWEGVDGLIHFQGESLEPELVIGEADGAVDMAYTADGMLWFAVPEYDIEYLMAPQTPPPAGMFRFDGTGWRRYTMDDGLNSNSVRRVEVAPDGTLWVGTDQGIDVYDSALDRFAPLGGGS